HRFVDPTRHAGVRGAACPGLAAIVRTENARTSGRSDCGVKPLRVARSYGKLSLGETVGYAFHDRFPGGPAVCGFENTALRTAPRCVFPRTLPLLPHRGIDDVRVGRIDVDILTAGVFVFIKNLLKCLSAVGRTEDTAFLVRTIRVAEDGNKK